MISSRDLFLRNLAQTSDFPLMLEIVSAEGIWLYGPDKKYIDLISGIGVSSVGHRHPMVIDAIKEQLDKHLHVMVFGELVQTPQVKLAEAMVKTLPVPLDNIYLVNSGSEAIEGAIKLSKRYTGRHEIISCFDAYHGSSHGALSISGSEDFKRAFRPLVPGSRQIKFGAIEDLSEITNKTAAVVIETVQGEGGVRTATAEYFQSLRQKCNQEECLLIIDEIQCGFGRTGKFWAFEHYNIVPDILTAAKGMGGGMPIGAFISTQEIMGVLKNNPILGHITTFGGHPVSSAAALATVNILLEGSLIGAVNRKAELFKSHLNHPAIKEVRNLGLMMAVEFESFEVLKPIIDRAIDKGALTDWFLFCDNSMRIAPPLTIEDDEIRQACKIIIEAIKG